LGAQYDNFNVTTYENFKKDGLYKMDLFQAEARMQVSANRKFTTGIGTRFDWKWYRPSIHSALDIRGKNEFVSGFMYVAANTLDKNVLPRRGWKIDGEFSHIFNQSPAVTFLSEGIPIENVDSFGISYNNYQRIILNAEAYAPLSPRVTLLTHFQGGVNPNYRQNILNDFMIGGLTRQFRNQITFAGLEEGAVYSASVASLLLGIRVELFNNVYVSGRSNVLASNFFNSGNELQSPSLLSGHAITFAYNFALGPLEVSVMYCDQSKQVRSYFNLGIPF
jgi:NTE family protein